MNPLFLGQYYRFLTFSFRSVPNLSRYVAEVKRCSGGEQTVQKLLGLLLTSASACCPAACLQHAGVLRRYHLEITAA